MSSETPDKVAHKHKKAKTKPEPSAQDETSAQKKSRKSKKLIEHASQSTVEAEAVESTDTTKEKKHKKRKHATEEHAGEVAEPPRKKKQKREGDTLAGDAAGEEGLEHDVGTSEKKVKKARKEDVGGEDKASKPPKDKKRRKGRDATVEGEETSGKPKKEKKRKHRSSSEYPDPTTDETLNEQAQKALQYAYIQFADRSAWKFNKARQNWLLRNVWSEETVPETYFTLACHYLQTVQGGVRETLVKTCREATETPSDPPTAAPAEATEADQAKDTDESAKRMVKFAVEPETSPTTSAVSVAKRQRAETLLAALTASGS